MQKFKGIKLKSVCDKKNIRIMILLDQIFKKRNSFIYGNLFKLSLCWISNVKFIFALWPSNFVFLYDNTINNFVVNLSERFRDWEKRVPKICNLYNYMSSFRDTLYLLIQKGTTFDHDFYVVQKMSTRVTNTISSYK